MFVLLDSLFADGVHLISDRQMKLTPIVLALLSGKSRGNYVGGSDSNKYSYNPECTPDVQSSLKWGKQDWGSTGELRSMTLEDCTLCHFIANKYPCENTAQVIDSI